MAKIAVILSGCGYLDGAEINETAFTLLSIKQHNLDYECFAPNIEQSDIINHLTSETKSAGTRNVMEESSRITRGQVSDLHTLDVNQFAALLIPGGFGVAKNLSTFAKEQELCSVNEDFKKTVLAFHKQKKAIGAICISPAIIGKIFEGKACITLTLGTNPNALALLTQLSMDPQSCPVDHFVHDKKHHIFSTPGYMEPDDIAGVYKGIHKMITAMCKDMIPTP